MTSDPFFAVLPGGRTGLAIDRLCTLILVNVGEKSYTHTWPLTIPDGDLQSIVFVQPYLRSVPFRSCFTDRPS